MVEIVNFTKNKINKVEIIDLVNFFLKEYKIKGEVSIAIIGDCRMKKINFTYRGKNKTTDVLSFTDLNEILISYPQIKRQASKYNKKIKDEFNFILVHGLLHLYGLDDYTELKRLKMIKKAEEFLSKYEEKKQ